MSALKQIKQNVYVDFFSIWSKKKKIFRFGSERKNAGERLNVQWCSVKKAKKDFSTYRRYKYDYKSKLSCIHKCLNYYVLRSLDFIYININKKQVIHKKLSLYNQCNKMQDNIVAVVIIINDVDFFY